MDCDKSTSELRPERLTPRGLARRRILALGLGPIVACLGASCAAPRSAQIGLPVKNTIQSDQLLVVSDFKLPKDHPLIKDLKTLRRQVSEALELPLGSKQVTVYLFSDELQYAQYLQSRFPGYPPRRAYFIQTPGKELAVYTWWGDRIQEDLRHEFTHGLLHAGLEGVPLWLDEGLAEYFEVAGPKPGQVNIEHTQGLAIALQNGWRPNLDRLESLEKVEHMQRPDYRESWAWVHYMLHSSPDTRQVLLNYLQDLRTDARPGSLHARLQDATPDCEGRLLSYVAGVSSFGPWLAAQPGGAVQPVRAASY
ncbi:MAG: hypothetical protein EXS05_23510 [Planctomycetaceae bacterium]|nr:hypothetical protein [Planctomycetaceae bacterium]